MRLTIRHKSLIQDFLSVFSLAAVTLLVLGDQLFSRNGYILSGVDGDVPRQFLAWRTFAFSELAHGHLALWNPHFFSGAPFLGGFQSALLYPPNWIYLVMPMGVAINVDLTLHTFLAGLFTYLWARQREFRRISSIVAGCVFMLGGAHYLHVYAGHLSNLATMAWAPLIFLAIDKVMDAGASRQTWRAAWIGAGAVAMQILAGHPQYVYYTALVALVYAIANLVKTPDRAGPIIGLLAMAGVGALIAAGQLFAGLGAAGQSIRSGRAYDKARLFAFPPENLLTMIAPNAFGSLAGGYWGRWTLWEDSLFIGVGALVLVIVGACFATRDARRFSLSMALLALVLSLGFYTPIYPILFAHLPGFSCFRGTSKFAFLALLFIAMLAGAGMDRMFRYRPISWRPLFILLGAGVLLAIAGDLIWLSASHGAASWFPRFVQKMLHGENRYLASTDAAGYSVAAGRIGAISFFHAAISCAAAALAWGLARQRRWGIYVLPIFVVAELSWFASQNHGRLNLRACQAVVRDVHRTVDSITPDCRVRNFPPGLVMLAGGNSIEGSDPLILTRYSDVADHINDWKSPVSNPLWRMFRLGYRVIDTPSGTTLRREDFDPLPRAFLAPNCYIAPALKDTLSILDNANLDLSQVAVLERSVDPSPRELLNTQSNFARLRGPNIPAVKVTDVSTDAMDITTYAPFNAILVVTDIYAAGWNARSLDANPLQDHYDVVPVDHALRGIPLVVGAHHLRLEYRPLGWIIGRWFSVVGVLVYFVWAQRVWRKESKED